MKFEAALQESEFEPIQAVWTHAAISTQQADPLCSSPMWQLAFYEAFCPTLRLFVESASDSLICFAEKIFSPSDIFLTPIESHWFFGCPLLGRHAVDLLARSMEFFAVEYAPHFPKIVISGVRPKRSLAYRLIKTFSNDFAITVHSWGLQCAASLKGGVDGYLARRSPGFRKKLKNAHQRTASRGISFERILPVSPEGALAAYSRMINVEKASWKGIHSCGMAESLAREFYAAMIRRMVRRANARVIMARCDDKDIGFIFGGIAGGIYRGQQFSYDDEWGEFSVGNLMQLEQIAWLCEEMAVRYDMGPIIGQGMEYKKYWAEKRIAFQCWMLEKK